MTQVFYQGQAEDGRQFKFSNAAGATFNAYVRDSLQPILQAKSIGASMDANVEQKTGKTGNTYTQVTAIDGNRGQAGAGGGFKGGGYGKPAYDNRTFVSNVVGSAIEKGLIDSPDKIGAWAKEAFKVISSLEAATLKDAIAKAPGAQPAPAPAPQPGQPLNDGIPF